MNVWTPKSSELWALEKDFTLLVVTGYVTWISFAVVRYATVVSPRRPPMFCVATSNICGISQVAISRAEDVCN